jgi:cell wall-associated NlpC family hydrolase
VFRKSSLLALLICSRALAAPLLWPEDRQRMSSYAQQFENSPYSFGARRPSSEDCSSLVQKIFSLVGVNLPRSSSEQARDARFQDVKTGELQSGDLVFFKNTWRRGVSHVAFMLSRETMLHSSPSSKTVRRSSLTPRHPLWKKIHSVRRWKYLINGSYIQPLYSWDEKI